MNEISEVYSYSENTEFDTSRDLFHSGMQSVFGPGVNDWNKLPETKKRDFIMVSLDKFEVARR